MQLISEIVPHLPQTFYHQKFTILNLKKVCNLISSMLYVNRKQQQMSVPQGGFMVAESMQQVQNNFSN